MDSSLPSQWYGPKYHLVELNVDTAPCEFEGRVADGAVIPNSSGLVLVSAEKPFNIFLEIKEPLLTLVSVALLFYDVAFSILKTCAKRNTSCKRLIYKQKKTLHYYVSLL